MRDRVRAYILENFLFESDPGALRDEDSFLERGILDSTGILEVVHWIEETFGIKVEDEEMVPENLDSVARLCAFIARRAGGGRSAS